MKYKEIYMNIKSLVNKFKKKDYWHLFSNKDQFYIADHREMLVSFTDDLYDNAYGLQFFFNQDGFNYVHERLTTEYEETVTIFDCDALFLKIVPKNDLADFEIDYLKKLGLRLTDNNMLIYRYKQGYKEALANKNELQIVYDIIEILNSIIPNELNDILVCFNDNNCACTFINDNYEYHMLYRPLPLLLRPYTKKPTNKQIVEEFKNKSYIDDTCYMFSTYAPFTVSETNIRPILVYFNFQKAKKQVLKYFIGKPTEYKDFIFSIIYEIFSEIGLPLKLIVNNLKIQAYIEKTVKALNIELYQIKEEEKINYGINELVQKLHFNASNSIVETEEGITLMLETITQFINEYDTNNPIADDDYENDEEITEYIC